MAPLPPGEPGVPGPGDERGPAPADGLSVLLARLGSRARVGLAVGVPALAALLLVAARPLEAGRLRASILSNALDTVPPAVRVLAAAFVLFGLCGFGLVRLLLPAGLRRHEPLWVLPVGAAASGLGLTVLGFAAVPFAISLPAVLAAGAGSSLYAWRRAGPPPRPTGRAGWPAYVALLVVLVALVPYFRAGFPTVIGEGSDAHLAAGSAVFLQHDYPTSVDAGLPVDRIPLTWRSKPPIYYALASLSTLSGLEPHEALAPTAALMLGLAALGFFLVAAELLGASLLAAVVAMALAGLDRVVLYTGMHPYFNQTWGYFAFPFALVLSWWAVRHRSPGGLALLALFLAIGAAAYPLAVPIPLVALAVAVFVERRERRARGERVEPLDPRRLHRGRRSLLWMIPVALALAVPAYGVAEKVISALDPLWPTHSLQSWGGDLPGFVPEARFFGLPVGWLAPLIAGQLVLAVLALRRVERPLAWALGTAAGLGLLGAAYFRPREFGYYFHFKTLAFVGPLVVVLAAVGLSRLRRAGVPLLGAFVILAGLGAALELRDTGYQLSRETIELRDWARELPPRASVRLDMWPPRQLWAGYFLASRPVCSQLPLFNSDYPRVPASRKADYIVAWHGRRRPADAAGPPLRTNAQYRLYRMRPGVPGPENCSRKMVQRITHVSVLGS